MAAPLLAKAGDAVRVDLGHGFVGATYVRNYYARNGSGLVYVVTVAGRERRVARHNIAKALP